MPKDDTASATSRYDLSLSLSIEDGDKPQEKLNIDYQTRKLDVNGGKIKVSQGDVNGETDRGDGVQLEVQQTVGQRSVGEEKRDLNGPDENSMIPKQDIDKNQIPETPNKEKRDVNSDGPKTPNEEKRDINSDGPKTPKLQNINSGTETPNEEKRDVNSGTKTPNEEKHDVNIDGIQLEVKQSVGEEKRDLNGPDTNPEPQEGDNPDTIDVNHNTENKLGSVIEITPQQQVMSFDNSVQSEIVDLSGKLVIDANTGNAYNIDEVDVSQFTEMYVVSCLDDPLQNYEKMTLQLLDDEIKKEGDEQPILLEIQVNQMTATTNENKQHTVTNPDKTEGKRDVNTEAKQNGDEKTEEKHDAVVTEANKDRDETTEGKHDVNTEAKQNGDEKTEEKRDAVVTEENKDRDETTERKRDVNTEAKQNGDEKTEEKGDAVVTEATEGKSDVGLSDDSCSSERNYMKKIYSYDSETEDTTASSSSENNKVPPTTDKHDVKAKAVQRDIEIDSDIQEIQPTTGKRDVKAKAVQRDVEIDSDIQEIQPTTDNYDVEEKCERPDSPDNSMVKMSGTRCTLVDKVPQRRNETRSQYRCNLARKFMKTDYRYKRSPNIGPELDFFEDDEGDESYKSDATYKAATSTSTDSCDKDSDDNSNPEDSVLYVNISFHFMFIT